MFRHVDTHRLRVGLVVTLIVLLAGVMVNLLLSATPALPVGILLAAAALDALALLLMRRLRVDAPQKPSQRKPRNVET
jgi:uncharacterized protein (TIGR03382 family)